MPDQQPALSALGKPAKKLLPWPFTLNPPPPEMTHPLSVKSDTLGFRGRLFAHLWPSADEFRPSRSAWFRVLGEPPGMSSNKKQE